MTSVDGGQAAAAVRVVRASRLRRGLLAGAAALVGAGLARFTTAERAEATHSVGTATGPVNNDAGAMHVDLVNNGTQRTFLVATVAGNPPIVIFNGSGPFSIGQADAIQGITRSNVGFAAGLQGRNQAPSGQSVGVFGTTSSTSGTGVFGTSGLLGGTIPTEATGVGVFGNGATTGVRGRSTAGIGVFGESISVASPSTQAGVFGVSPAGPGVLGTSTSAFGVQGLSADAFGVSGNSTTQPGVWGSSDNNVGVLGTSNTSVGVSGVSTSSNGVNALSTSGIGIFASSVSGPAGRFEGDVVVIGNLLVSGTFPQSTALPSSDGTLRRVYSLDSVEAHLEDFGHGSLTNGVATISLDPDFAALILADTYSVFLTPYGDCRGLYVSGLSPQGFEVREVQGGTSSIGFGYRVLARPKSAISPRLDRVTIPAAPPRSQLDRMAPLDVPARLRDIQRASDGAPAGPTNVPDVQNPAPSR